jgi:hypothetical protein
LHSSQQKSAHEQRETQNGELSFARLRFLVARRLKRADICMAAKRPPPADLGRWTIAAITRCLKRGYIGASICGEVKKKATFLTCR